MHSVPSEVVSKEIRRGKMAARNETRHLELARKRTVRGFDAGRVVSDNDGSLH